MKASEIIDAVIEGSRYAIEIELPNGNRMTTKDYRWDENKRGEPVIVIQAGKPKQ